MKQRYIFSSVEVEDISENIAYELVRTGMQYTDRYGDFAFTREQLEEMSTNFNAGIAGHEIAVDVNHDPERRAYAWIQPGSMYVGPSMIVQGEYSLYARLHRFTPEGEHFVKTGAFRYFSIEYVKSFNTWIDGVKKSAKNVILGLALTNRPAVKGLAPTFTDLNHSDMEILTKLLSNLKTREIVSKEDKDMLATLLSDLPEEDAEAVKADVEEVNAKPEEVEKEEVVEEEKAEDAEPAKEEAPEADAPAEASLSELVTMKEQVATMAQELSALRAEKEEASISLLFSSLVISEENPTGFVKTSEEAVKSFLRSLNEGQRAEFSALVKDVKNVDFVVHGTEEYANTPEDAMEKKAQKLADEMMKKDEKLKKFEALSAAYKELGMTKPTK